MSNSGGANPGDQKFIQAVNRATAWMESAFEGASVPQPKVTVIMANGNDPLMIVNNENGRNVPSGTCIDNTEGLFRALTLDQSKPNNEEDAETLCREEDYSENINFFLLSQDGQLGVSKGVSYRCSFNENKRVTTTEEGVTTTPLDKNQMHLLTYHLSFCVGTAQCVTRLPAVLFYPKKFADLALSWIPGLEGEKAGGFIDPVDNEETPRIYRFKNGCPHLVDGDGHFFTHFLA